jgi:hypothetical protein
MWVTLPYPQVHSFGYMPKSGISGSYGSSIFSFLRNLHIAFHSGCTNLHSHQQCRSVLSPHILTSICCLLLMIVNLIGARLNLKMQILICISFMVKDVSISSYVYWSFVLLLRIVFSVHLPFCSVGCLFFERLVFWAPYIFWLLVPCQMYNWQRFFFHSVDCLFSLGLFPLLCRSFLVSCSPICQYFS